jgi:hypothetical protein
MSVASNRGWEDSKAAAGKTTLHSVRVEVGISGVLEALD